MSRILKVSLVVGSLIVAGRVHDTGGGTVSRPVGRGAVRRGAQCCRSERGGWRCHRLLAGQRR